MDELERYFAFYRIFLEAKLHFTTEKFILGKNHKKYKEDTVHKFRDGRLLRIFKILSKKYRSYDIYHEFLISVFLEKTDFDATFLLTKEADDMYNKWKSRVDAMRQTFINEISSVIKIHPVEFFYTDGFDLPIAFKRLLDKTISFETMVFLFKYLNLEKRWECLSRNSIYKEYELKIRKYSLVVDFKYDMMTPVVSKMFREWTKYHKN